MCVGWRMVIYRTSMDMHAAARSGCPACYLAMLIHHPTVIRFCSSASNLHLTILYYAPCAIGLAGHGAKFR